MRASAWKATPRENDPTAIVHRLSGDRLLSWLSHEAGPTLVLFDAPWSSACHLALEVLVALKKDLGSQVQMRAVDAVGCPEASSRFGIECVPTLILYWRGCVIARWEGARSRIVLKREVGIAIESATRRPTTGAANTCCKTSTDLIAPGFRLMRRGVR